MKLTKEEATEIVYGDNADYSPVLETIVGQSRWITRIKAIYEHLPTHKFYMVYFDKGSTECQETELFYGDEVEFVEVKKEKFL